MKAKILLWCVLLTLLPRLSFSQQVDSVDLFTMDLEQLMNVQIVTASQKSENLFDAPLSVSAISKVEIKRAGCTSIVEALKLMPGLVVREQTNGNYDVHLRGLDNIPPIGTFVFSYNTTTLVMIDNRPVFNYYQGGTFWETLPVDLNDVERIEVVRGPASAMYGPNAVSGVIHIITRQATKDKLFTVANAQYGTNNTVIANASVGYKFSKKFGMILSGNLQERDRGQTSYYDLFSNAWVDNVDSLRDLRGSLVPNATTLYPDPTLALSKHGANAFLEITPTEKVNISISGGMQNSEAQKVYFDTPSGPLSFSTSRTNYADIKASAGNLNAQVSYLDGTQQLQGGNPSSEYDFTTLDALVEYKFVFKKLLLKPGFNFRNANYDDTPYTTDENSAFGNSTITTQAAFLRSEYSMLEDKFRLIAAVRVDKFNFPEKLYPSYQFSANYKLKERHQLRFVFARSNRSPFINDTYLDIIASRRPSRKKGKVVPGRFNEVIVKGSKDLDLVTSDMFELGFRSKLAENLQMDIEVWTATTKDFSLSIIGKDFVVIKGPADTVTVTPIDYTNIPLYTTQIGTTISINYVVKNLQVKPFVTIQNTSLNDYSEYSNQPDATPSVPATTGNLGNPAQNNIYSGVGTSQDHKSTPKVFGGAYINYRISPKFGINVNPYFFTAQKFYHRTYTNFRDDIHGVDEIEGKLQLNAKLSYLPIKQLDIFISGKNILGNDSREFYKSDNIGKSFLVGLSFEF